MKNLTWNTRLEGMLARVEQVLGTDPAEVSLRSMVVEDIADAYFIARDSDPDYATYRLSHWGAGVQIERVYKVFAECAAIMGDVAEPGSIPAEMIRTLANLRRADEQIFRTRTTPLSDEARAAALVLVANTYRPYPHADEAVIAAAQGLLPQLNRPQVVELLDEFAVIRQTSPPSRENPFGTYVQHATKADGIVEWLNMRAADAVATCKGQPR